MSVLKFPQGHSDRRGAAPAIPGTCPSWSFHRDTVPDGEQPRQSRGHVRPEVSTGTQCQMKEQLMLSRDIPIPIGTQRQSKRLKPTLKHPRPTQCIVKLWATIIERLPRATASIPSPDCQFHSQSRYSLEPVPFLPRSDSSSYVPFCPDWPIGCL